MVLSPEELFQEGVSVPTAEQYRRFVKVANEPEVLKQLPGGGSVGWFGSKDATRVLGYLPGGALVLNANSVWMRKIYDMYLAGKAVDHDFAVAILAFDTISAAPYPAQFRQTCSFVEYLMENRLPSNIELGGDSAGGALILGFCLHIHHPHPKIAPFTKLKADQAFGRVLLCSPMGPVRTASVILSKNNQDGDLKEGMLKSVWEMLNSAKEPNVEFIGPWMTPAWIMKEPWYTSLPVGEITMIWGAKDILNDDITRLSHVLLVNHSKAVHVFVDEQSGHSPYLQEQTEGGPVSEYTKKRIQWVKKEF